MDRQIITEGETIAMGFWSKHKRLCVEILVALLLLVGGFATGKFTTHPQVEIKTITKTEVQTKTVVQYQDRVVEKKVYVSTEKKHEHTTETTTKKPDGTVVTTKETTTDEDDSKGKTTDTDAQHNQTQTVTQVVTQTVFKDKLVLQQPGWAVSAGVGYDFSAIGGLGQHGVPGMQGAVVQVGLDRRVVGPFWLGLFGNTEGVAGLNLRVAW